MLTSPRNTEIVDQRVPEICGRVFESLSFRTLDLVGRLIENGALNFKHMEDIEKEVESEWEGSSGYPSVMKVKLEENDAVSVV